MKAALAVFLAMPFAALAANAIPTFESLGLYWTPPADPGAGGCEVRYRKATESAWKQGLNLWYDARNGECRGSLVQLEPGNQYEVELSIAGQAPPATLTARTWSEPFPIARTVQVASGPGTLNITEGGTPGSYVLYTGPATLDAANAADYNVQISAPYVIVRGLTLRGARIDAIRLAPGAHDVVIEDNDISGWGRFRTMIAPGWAGGVDGDSAIRARCGGAPWLERAIIQRNRLHHPRYGANSWDYGHPQGPQAISFQNCGGNHVIRYNEIYSSENHYFNDAIGGGQNFSAGGFPNADSDIYGNRISHAWDEAIEAEGANRNVRIWGNYTDQTAAAIATTPTHVGPVYIFRNVMNRSRLLSGSASDNDQDSGRVFAKAGSTASFGGGRRYVVHNTLLQAPPPEGSLYEQGAGTGLRGSASQPLTNTLSRNNIYHIRKSSLAAIDEGSAGEANDLDYDLVNGNVIAHPGAEANGIVGTPVYAEGHGASAEARGLYQLATASPGYDGGVPLANFNDGFTGAAPDMGAHEAGTAPMRFGVAAPAAPRILWSAGMETGDLTEWEEENNSGSADSVAVTAAASGIPPKSGNWVMRQTVNGTGGSRMHLVRQVSQLAKEGKTFYTSWWYYLPEKITFPLGSFFAPWQMVSFDAAGVPNPVWALFYESRDQTLTLGWSPAGNGPAEGPHAGEFGTRGYASTVPLPIGQWMFIEIMVTPSAQFTGAIKLWLNGQVLFDLSGIKTRFPDEGLGGLMYTSHNGYGANLSPNPAHHYLDDVALSLERLR